MTAGSTHSSSNRWRMWPASEWLTIGFALAISWSQKSSHDSSDTRWRFPANWRRSSDTADVSSLHQHSIASAAELMRIINK